MQITDCLYCRNCVGKDSGCRMFFSEYKFPWFFRNWEIAITNNNNKNKPKTWPTVPSSELRKFQKLLKLLLAYTG